MKIVKYVGIVFAVYVGIVVLFESLIGYFQPSSEGTLVIRTMEVGGEPRDRVVSRLESGGQLYVAANHWPRAWFNRALENPDVEVALDGDRAAYRAVLVSGAEHDRVDSDNSLPMVFRILTGFPPRYFLRLDPQ